MAQGTHSDNALPMARNAVDVVKVIISRQSERSCRDRGKVRDHQGVARQCMRSSRMRSPT